MKRCNKSVFYAKMSSRRVSWDKWNEKEFNTADDDDIRMRLGIFTNLHFERWEKCFRNDLIIFFNIPKQVWMMSHGWDSCFEDFGMINATAQIYANF